MDIFPFHFGTDNFWNNHGIFFLFFITLFPRLTLLFSSVAFGGLFWWIGFIFAPRILVAVLATLSYWRENPILVFMSWVVALSGESGEKMYMKRNVKIYKWRNNPRSQWDTNIYVDSQNESQPKSFKDSNVIDVEYKKMD
jgi:hypothetical protein